MAIKRRAGASSLPLDKGGLRGVSHVPYDRRLTAIARENRNNPTDAEKQLWRAISRKQLGGWKFTRQKPLGQFIADFYCAELMLVVEIDGDSHAGQEEYDALRSDILKKMYGIECVRFSNREVLGNIDGVVADLSERVALIRRNPLSPPCQGEEDWQPA